MKFELKSDITFFADNLEDAFVKLMGHFLALANDAESGLEFLGTIELKASGSGAVPTPPSVQ